MCVYKYKCNPNFIVSSGEIDGINSDIILLCHKHLFLMYTYFHSLTFFLPRFNVPHDDSFKCKESGIKNDYHVMAPTLNYHTNPWTWSKCSQKYITEFLE